MVKRIACFLLFFYGLFGYGQAHKFKVVLDAGHGGKDYGAVYHGNIEKNIALKTALKVGAILENDPQQVQDFRLRPEHIRNCYALWNSLGA